MTTAPHPLHDALVDLADEVAPASASTAVPPGATDPWRRAVVRRRRQRVAWVGAAVAAGVVVVVAAQAASYGIHGRRVVPVSVPAGPGSLPDRIYPTRSAILSVEQAPIGRAALVYSGPQLYGPGGFSQLDYRPIAVGADSDEYRALPLASAWSLSPDGRTYAYVEPLDSVGRTASRLDLVDLATGVHRSVRLPDLGHGLHSAALYWSADSRRVLAEVDAATSGPTGVNSSEGRVLADLVDVPAGRATGRPADVGSVVGWYGSSSLVEESVDTTTSATGAQVNVVSLVDPATGTTVRTLGDAAYPPGGGPVGQPLQYLSPGGDLLAQTSQDGRGSSLVQVLDLRNGGVLWTSPDATLPPELLVAQSPDLQQPIGWASSSAVLVLHFHPRLAADNGQSVDVTSVEVPSGRTTVLARAAAEANVEEVQVAADVVAGGKVRSTSAPHQPLLDPRTLLPLTTGWLATNPGTVGLLAVLALLTGIPVVAMVRAVRAGRRERRQQALRAGG